MKIVLNRLTLTNFKGIRSFSLEFGHTTNIYGQNATGKTSLMDAFLWLLFGKDSTDRKDFEIKTLDEKNEPYHRLDHEVSAILVVDGDEIVIRRVFKEKWTTKRGSATPEFTGHQTDFYWNDVPLKQEEYQAKVAGILNENLFKLITNVSYFNSLKWQERRNILLDIGGKIENSDVLSKIAAHASSSHILELTNALTKKSLEEYKREVTSKRLKIKNDLQQFPSRIDEANRSLPEEKDYAALEKEVTVAIRSRNDIDNLILDNSKAKKLIVDGKTEKIQEAYGYRKRCDEIEFNEKNKALDKKRSREQVILTKKRELQNLQDDLSRSLLDYNNEAKRKEGQKLIDQDLRKRYAEINAEEIKFNDSEFCCPTCKRPYEADNIDAKKKELTENFNKNKSDRLTNLTLQGKNVSEQIKLIDAKLLNLKKDQEVMQAKVDVVRQEIATLEQEHINLTASEEQDVKQAISENTEWQGLQEMVRLRNEEINTPEPNDNNSALLQQKNDINIKIDELNKQLAGKQQREKTLARIKELEDQERKMAQELADLEGIEFTILQFEKTKMDELENRINNRFKIARFKMFELQINGGEEPTCVTLVKGVPYEDANTAAQIQVGLDIINTLSDHYGVQAPVWIDNRESVINLPETKAQVISLIVSKSHPELKVEKPEMEMAAA
jgi:exonuclease SbcC